MVQIAWQAADGADLAKAAAVGDPPDRHERPLLVEDHHVPVAVERPGDRGNFTDFSVSEDFRPGAYELQEGLTVLKVCALAGGFTNYAAQNAVKITRNERGSMKTIKLDLKVVR